MTTNEDIALEQPTTPESRAEARRAAAEQALRTILPGVAAAVAIAAVATIAGGFFPVVGAPAIAILIGMAIAITRKPSRTLRAGIDFTSKKVLQGSVVVLGLNLSFSEVLSAGARSLPVLIGTLVAALGVAWVAGRALHLRRDLTTLVGVGTAICGASAIAATDAVIDADQADVSYSIATIFTFNVIAVLLYPTLGHVFGFSQRTFGLWAGTAINDVSSVVAASTTYGHVAATYAVIVKLTRSLAIVPIALGLAALRGMREGKGQATGRGRVSIRRILPFFMVLFVVAVATNTVGLVPAGWHHDLSNLAIWAITAALAAIGLSTDVGHIRRAGFRPLALGAILWLTVGLTSIGLQALTGTL